MKRQVGAMAATVVTVLGLGLTTTPAHGASGVRAAVVDAAKAYLGTPYRLAYGWTCGVQAVDCECLNRHAIWDGTKAATGRGLQLNYWLQGQINQGRRVSTPRPGDLVFWDTDPHDGIRYGGDLDHTGVYIGNNRVIDANAYYGYVRNDSVTLGGTEPDPLFVDVLTPNGY
ncbi:C40 family peptidase [Micromonospora sp. CPCC 205561]|uniref:C40 family peptidase n=1 Tax=Micromonospora sp. CPCC 205561 TaxID=3122407 RepID=UPI002FF240A0